MHQMFNIPNLKLMPNHRLNLRSLQTFLTVDDETFERLQKRFESMVQKLVKRAGTVQSSLFLLKFPFLFLAHCRK